MQKASSYEIGNTPKRKKKKSRLVVPNFSCKSLGKAAGSCLSAVSTLDISLIILVLEIVG